MQDVYFKEEKNKIPLAEGDRSGIIEVRKGYLNPLINNLGSWAYSSWNQEMANKFKINPQENSSFNYFQDFSVFEFIINPLVSNRIKFKTHVIEFQKTITQR